MSDTTKGGGWVGGGDANAIDHGLLEYFKEVGKNGIVIDGVIAWINVQQDRSADGIWKDQANDSYTDDEINAAKAALWNASEKNIGSDAPVIICESKKKNYIDDIRNALTKLKLSNTKLAVFGIQ